MQDLVSVLDLIVKGPSRSSASTKGNSAASIVRTWSRCVECESAKVVQNGGLVRTRSPVPHLFLRLDCIHDPRLEVCLFLRPSRDRSPGRISIQRGVGKDVHKKATTESNVQELQIGNERQEGQPLRQTLLLAAKLA